MLTRHIGRLRRVGHVYFTLPRGHGGAAYHHHANTLWCEEILGVDRGTLLYVR